MAEAIDDNGTRFVDVMDPDSGSMFRFYEVEFSLACAMDGQRDVAGIVQWAKEELGLAPSPAEVRTVIATLGELGYLDHTAAAKAAAAAPPAAAAAAAAAAAPPAAKPSVRDEALAPGVVVGAQPKQKPTAPITDIELGHVATPAPVAREELPEAPDLALGAPGSTSAPVIARNVVEDVPLGAPGKSPEPVPQVSEVSLDLSEHMGVRPDDVKEAVRASKVMQAVDVPKELLEAEAPKRPTPPPEPPKRATPPPMKAVQPPAEEPKRPAPQPEVAKPVAPEPVLAKPVEKPVEKPAIVTKPVVEKPVEKPVEKKPVAPPAPERRVSPLLVVLLIVLVGVGAFAVWKFVLSKSNEQAKTGAVQQPTPPAPTPTPTPTPAPPAEPVVKLAVETPGPIEMKAAVEGVVETIEPARTVKRDEVLVRLVGHKPLATEVAALQRDIENRVGKEVKKGEADLLAAQTTNDAAKIKAAQTFLDGRKKSLADKEEQLAKKQAELDKRLVKAPADGAYTPVAAAKTKVAVDAPLFTVAPAPVLVATFKTTTPPAANTKVFVAVKGSESKLTCRVTAVDNTDAKVECPNDPALAGAEVTLAGPAPDEAPATPAETPAPGEGSAAGSAAPTEKAPESPTEAPKPPTPAKQPARQPARQPAKPAEPKPAETKPAETKPAETKPAEGETKPAEPTPAPADGSN